MLKDHITIMNVISKQKGLNLIEIMIVIAIVGILASIGYPLYQDQMERTRRADGKAKLLEVIEAQERFYSANNRYTTTLASIGYTTVPVPSEEGFYLVNATICPGPIALTQCVLCTATAQGVQAADGNLTLDSRNNKTPASHW